MTQVAAFLKFYFKHYGAIAAAASFIALVYFFIAIVPNEAIYPSGTYEFAQNPVGGVQTVSGKMNVAVDMSAPRNENGEKLRYIGDFRVTHYCACTICTWGSGITASGKPVAEGMIAADWKVLPRGTVVYIKRGDTFIKKVVEDTGGAINDNRIDVYVPSHDGALSMGVYTAELYVDPGTELP